MTLPCDRLSQGGEGVRKKKIRRSAGKLMGRNKSKSESDVSRRNKEQVEEKDLSEGEFETLKLQSFLKS